MPREQYLWVIPEREEENLKAMEILSKIPGVTISVIKCPPSVEDLYDLPLTRDERGGAYSGLDEIQQLVSQSLKRGQMSRSRSMA